MDIIFAPIFFPREASLHYAVSNNIFKTNNISVSFEKANSGETQSPSPLRIYKPRFLDFLLWNQNQQMYHNVDS